MVHLATLQRVLVLLTAMAMAGIATAQWLWFRAGCVGDTKGGSLGDPVQALQIETQAAIVQMLALLVATAAITIFARRWPGGPALYGGAFFVVGIVCLWFVGIEVETMGVRACF